MNPPRCIEITTVDENPVILLLIGPQVSHKMTNSVTIYLLSQNDFHDGGSLVVLHATEDAKKIAAMIRKNKAKIHEIFVTLDSHHKKHIAHQSFWSDRQNDREGAGKVPGYFTQILAKDIAVQGGWWPRDCSLEVSRATYQLFALD